MKRVRKLLPKQLLGYFGFYYDYLGYSVFIALASSLMIAVLDGIGLTMFLPLLQVTGEKGELNAPTQELGDMAFVVERLIAFGIPMTVVSILILMIVFFSLKGVAKYFSAYYTAILRRRFANKLRLISVKLLAGYDYRAFSKADSGRIQNTLSGETERLSGSYRAYFNMLQQAVMTLVYVGLAYMANPKFALIVGVGGVVSNLAFNNIYKSTKSASRKVTVKNNTFQGFLIQSVSSYKFLKATNLIQNYGVKINQAIDQIETQQLRIGKMGSLASAIREPLIIFVVVIGIFVQVVIFGGSIGMIILSLLFFYRGLTSLVAMQSFYNSFLSSVGSIENMESFLEELKLNQEDPGDIVFSNVERGIEVKDLSYYYDDGPVFEGLSFGLRKNQTIGIVGASGTGKTTLANILCGLLTPPRGTVFIDGVDINDIDLNSFRSRIGYVTQESQIFSDTVYNNVSFWAPKTPGNVERVRQALQSAHAIEFVDSLTDGLDTDIGMNGINLSGGQRQRISIAREMYREVEILVLDEATSALDSQSEQYIQENIDAMAGQYTMIVIAHRLSTIKKADKIIYLKTDGYEIGTFTSLVERNPNFKKMVELQSVGFA